MCQFFPAAGQNEISFSLDKSLRKRYNTLWSGRSCAASELVKYTPKPRVVCDDAAFGDLNIHNPIFDVSCL